MGETVLLMIFLILMTSLAHTAQISAKEINTSKVKAKAEEGDKKAKSLQKIAENPEKYQASQNLLKLLCVGFTFAVGILNLTEPLATVMFAKEVQGFEYAVSSAVITLVTVIVFALFAYGVPESLVAGKGEKIAYAMCGFNLFFACFLRPLTLLLEKIAGVCVRIFGVNPDDKEGVSQEDIVSMLDAGAEDGTIDANDIEYIKNVFQLENKTATDIMTPRSSMELISADASDSEIMKTVDESGYSRIPVYKDNTDNITGILYVRDYLFKRNDEDFNISKATFEPTFVPESVHLDALFRDMQMDHNHIVIVVDEYGGTAGLVTMEDILEELVGEIWDEQDEEVENIVKIDEDKYTVLSSTPIDEFFEFFDLPEDEETESATVNGWITEHSGSIPEEGFTFEYKNLTVTVLKADGLHTEEISVKVQPKAEEEEE